MRWKQPSRFAVTVAAVIGVYAIAVATVILAAAAVFGPFPGAVSAVRATYESLVLQIFMSLTAVLTLALGMAVWSRRRSERKRLRLIGELHAMTNKVKSLRGLLAICASCKKIRRDDGGWDHIETYITRHSGAEFTHGVCPECLGKLYPDTYRNAS